MESDREKDQESDNKKTVIQNIDTATKKRIAEEMARVAKRQRQLANHVTRIASPILEAQRKLEVVFEDITSTKAVVEDTLKNVALPVQRINRIFERDINLSSVNDMLDVFEAVKDRLRPLKDKRQKFNMLLMFLGWPPPKDIVAGWVPRLGSAYEKYQRDEISQDELEAFANKVIIEAYTDGMLSKMAKKWSEHPLLEERSNIINDALEAHVSGTYTLSIPALLPLIDYLSAETFAYEGQLHGKKRAEFLHDILNDKQLDTVQRREVFSNFMEHFLYSPALYRKGDPIPISRHNIVHGIKDGYDTEVNSLKVILFIDHIVTSLKYVTSSQSDKYHRFGCYQTQQIDTSNKHFLRGAFLAERHNLEPCDSCIREP